MTADRLADDDTRDPLAAATRFMAEQGAVAMATVIDTWGSSPVPIGGQLAIAKDGRFAGSVSGGCVEGEVITEAEEVLASGRPRILEYGVEDETAWRVGLPCGGKIKLMVAPFTDSGARDRLERLRGARRQRIGLVVDTDLETGSVAIHERAGAIDADILDRFRSGRSSVVEQGPARIFRHALMPPPRVIIIGATHIGQVLAELVRLTGYQAIVVDPRTAFAAETRFPHIELATEWPQDALPRLGVDAFTAVVALAHVGHIDDEALKIALRSEAMYIGALGSKRNHAKRVERLTEAGFTAAEIARIKAPIGLDIGAETPPEIAMSVMAEVVRALRGTKGKGAA
jgi:xanthine dehydrogenase accessory factor